MKKFINIRVSFILMVLFIFACKGRAPEEDSAGEPVTPVSIGKIVKVPMTDQIELNAVAGYLQRETVRASATGFLESVKVSLGQEAAAGSLLFRIRTKEGRALKNMNADSTLHFSGLIDVVCTTRGIVTQLNHHPGDYVSESDPLAILVEPSSLVFLMKVPFEYHKNVQAGKAVQLVMPDGSRIRGAIGRAIPTVDPATQAQDYVVNVSNCGILPEGLQVTVMLNASGGHIVNALNKSCVLSNETQTRFWVMKLISDSVAVKVPIQKGTESDSLVEIVSPVFSSGDRFVSQGNYGLPDTAMVKVTENN